MTNEVKTKTNPNYPYLINGRYGRYTMDHMDIKLALGLIPPMGPNDKYLKDKKVPKDVSTPWTDINGVMVRYMTSDAAKQFWCPNGGRKGMYMRAIAICPDCRKIVAASRINQHARVHKWAKG